MGDTIEEWLKKVDGVLIGDPMQSLGYPEIETEGSSYELEAGRQRTDLCKKLLALVCTYREANEYYADWSMAQHFPHAKARSAEEKALKILNE